MGKPSIFKIHGCWVWMCTHPEPAEAGEAGEDEGTKVHSERFTDEVPHPWAVCLADALVHFRGHHYAENVEEV